MTTAHTTASTRRRLLAVFFCLGLGALAWAFAGSPRRAEEEWPAPTMRMRLDANAADAGELAVLPAIGPALAQAIVEDRTVRGRFASVEDLRRVKGIGPRKWAQLRPWVEAR